MAGKKIIRKSSSIILGRNIQRTRMAKDMTRMQLARKINKKEQDITRYETGNFVPLPTLEKIGIAFDEPIAKKIIRRISFVRKLETEQQAEYDDELTDLYNEALPEIEEDDE